jgi:hypothetical protein
VSRTAVSTPARARHAATAPLHATTLIRFDSPIVMRGELRAPYSAPIPIEIILHRLPANKGRSLQGRVRFPQHEHERDYAPFHVTGSVDDEKITLSQVRIAQHGVGGAWFGYIFVLERPGSPASKEWSGTWTLGGRRGSLAVALPPAL